jgi:N-dimethylarginine dimethylaminohydrolase
MIKLTPNMKLINQNLLISGVEYFSDEFAINAYMDNTIPIDIQKAKKEHDEIIKCFESAGIKVTKVKPPEGCQDGIYTANWALIVNNKAIMSNLPNKREAEIPYAEKILKNIGLDIIKLPKHIRFGGQGDALACGQYLFCGTKFRTSIEAHILLAQETGLEVVGLQTIPQLDENQNAVINSVTGWPDSYFFDIDLALAVINPNLIAWCPEAFMPESQEKIRKLDNIEKIEVSLEETMEGFACNLVSTGKTVIMSDQAPMLQQSLKQYGLKVYTPNITELIKGGGFIRCISLTLS